MLAQNRIHFYTGPQAQRFLRWHTAASFLVLAHRSALFLLAQSSEQQAFFVLLQSNTLFSDSNVEQAFFVLAQSSRAF